MPTGELATITTQAQRILSHPTWDLVLIFALLAAGFFYGISAGKRRIAATILYTYVSLAVSSALPLDGWIQSSQDMEKFYIRGGVFLGLFFASGADFGFKKKPGRVCAGKLLVENFSIELSSGGPFDPHGFAVFAGG